MPFLPVVSWRRAGDAEDKEALWERRAMALEVHSSVEPHSQLGNLGKRVEGNALENGNPPVEEGPPPQQAEL